MSELRQDRTTGRWVICAPGRRRRSGEWATKVEQAQIGPRFEPTCPFCPGNERQLPGIVAEAPADNAPGWRVRAIPNKFPALLDQVTPEDAQFPGHHVHPGYGFHEVVIESPWHNADPATMTRSDRLAVVSMLQQRAGALLAKPGIETVVIFRNHGPKGGASLAHPHSQIVALGLIPPKLNALVEGGLRHFQRHGRCATCEEIDLELRVGTRIVDENAQFLAIVPFAAERPFESWILPKRHRASFIDSTEQELKAFSDLLGRILRRLRTALNNPPYSFVIDCAPKSKMSEPYFHWRTRIVPKTVTWGGFELGTDLPINPSNPEDDAATLRAVLIKDVR